MLKCSLKLFKKIIAVNIKNNIKEIYAVKKKQKKIFDLKILKKATLISLKQYNVYFCYRNSRWC